MFLRLHLNKLKLCLTSVRSYATERKFPIDRSLEDAMPVWEYPTLMDGKNIVYVWGLAEHGALGLYLQKKKVKTRRHFKFCHRPMRLQFAELNNVVSVTAGYGFTALAVKLKDGVQVFGTGVNTDSQIGTHEPRKDHPLGMLISPAPIGQPFPKGMKVLNMAAGRAHLVINTSQGVYTLGNNAYGQCGRYIIEDEKYSGSNVMHHIQDCEGETIEQVECGQDHTLFLTSSGSVFSCGWGADGQTGLGHYNNCGTVTRVEGDIKGEKIIKISSKADCVLAINESGDVFGWGNSEYSQLLNPDDTQQQINIPTYIKKCKQLGKIVDVAAAGSLCLALNDVGEVYSWGYGILGRGPVATHSWNPEIIPPILFGKNEYHGDVKVTSISCGMNFCGAINNMGDIYMWGKNLNGCLGLGHEKDQFFPLKVAIGAFAKKLYCGVDHTVAFCEAY